MIADFFRRLEKDLQAPLATRGFASNRHLQ
jgi:hypothetical protein